MHIPAGTRINISGVTPGAPSYPSLVMDEGDRWLQLAWPPVGRQLAAFHPQQRLRATWTNPRSLYYFESEIIRCLVEPVPALYVAWPAPIGSVERRRYDRLASTLPCRCTPIQAPDGSTLPDQPALSGQMQDISATGVGVLLDLALAVGTTVIFDVDLPWGPRIMALARVVRAVPELDGFLHHNGMRFVRLDDPTRQAILRYMEEERLRRGGPF